MEVLIGARRGANQTASSDPPGSRATRALLIPIGNGMTTQTRTLYAFFPYLRTRHRCVVRGVELRPMKDLSGLDDESKKHVEILGRMFHTCDGARIAEPTFAVLRVPEDGGTAKVDRGLIETQLLFAYLYGTPHASTSFGDNPFLSAECCSLFTFTPNRVATSLVTTTTDAVRTGRLTVEDVDSLPTSDFVDGYDGYRNGDIPLWVADGSCIYPEIPHLCLNYYQDLQNDIKRFLAAEKHWPFQRIFERHDLPAPNQNRVFTSLLWYLRSCKATADATERLMALAIGLETLLCWKKEIV